MFKEKLLKRALAAYAGQHVLQRVLEYGEDALKLGGQVENLTIYFQDVAHMTTTSESLTPEELVRLLYEYFSVMTKIIEDHKGVVIQYMADAIMALWGINGATDHADRACSCAIEAVYKASLLTPPLKLTVGINSGSVVLGNIGGSDRFQFTVLGDHVSLASRLEGYNKKYGTNILFSEFTRQALVEHKTVREVTSVQEMGLRKPVKLYTFGPEYTQQTPALDEPTHG